MPDQNQPQLDPNSFQPLNGAGASGSSQSATQLDPNSFQPLTQGGTPTGTISQNHGPDSLDIHPDDNIGTKIAKGVNKVGAGIGTGLLDTITGGMGLEDRIAKHLPNGVANTVLGSQEDRTKTEQFLQHKRDELSSQNSTDPGYGNAGYGGESFLEFYLGEGALKGALSAEQVLNAGKALKIIESNPKMIAALKIGAKQLAAQSARAGAVQGAQTLVRTGGDVGEAAKAGLETAGTTAALGGVLGGAAGAVGQIASKAGEAAKAAGELADTAANAPDKQSIAENIQGQLHNSKTALHEGYESGIKDITNRLGNNSVPAQNSPISTRAKELLAKPNPEDHEWTQQAKELAGDHLDSKTKGLLQSLADGTKPLTEDEIAEAKEASKPSGLLDASGKPVKAEAVEPQAQPAAPLTGHDLIELRQSIRKAAAGYPIGDVNARALNSLLWDGSTHSSAIDDTMDQIAAKSGDLKAVSDYQALRNDYRSKINIYDNPVIKNMMEGKPDDAAKAFIATKSASGLPTGGKTEFNVDQLKTIIGDKGFTHFRDSVFDNLLKTASDEKSGFNPAKFVDSWSRISDGTKKELFGAHDPAVLPQNYVTSLVQDAKAASNFQKLTRAGLIGAVGAGAGTIAPVAGAGIGTVLAFIAGHEGAGGIAKGRDILDYVANHPRTWATFRKLGAVADSGAAGKVARTATQSGKAIGNQIATSDEKDANDKASLQRIMQGPAQALSQ